MTEWTAERLDALPQGTLIEFCCWTGGGPRWAVRDVRYWLHVGRASCDYSSILLAEADPDSIRVVSLPIDALLDDDVIAEAGREIAKSLAVNRACTYSAKRALRAAIAHMTGGQP